MERVGLAEEAVSVWVERLWGINRARQEQALAQVDGWNIPHLSNTLTRSNADGVIGAVFIVEAIDTLIERGVDANKPIGKLRSDPDVWPSWAEIRAAGLIARYTALDARFLLEPDRGSGRHADFAFQYGEGERQGERHSIEFKASGLSDEEARFADSMLPLLEGLLPRVGLLHMHLLETKLEVSLNRSERRWHQHEAERRSKNLHPQVRPIAAATIVGHGTAASYTRRLTGRFTEAFAQLPADDDCWVAFHWSNGAPVDMVRRVLAGIEIPDHVVGVALVGTIAIPGGIHNFIVQLPRPFHTTEGEEIWYSDTGVEDAQNLFEATDTSSGVRATYIRVPYRGTTVDFLMRGGAQRIFPFNLVLAPDPPDLVPPRDPDASR